MKTPRGTLVAQNFFTLFWSFYLNVLRASTVKLDSFLSAQWICCGQDKKEDEGTFIFPSSTKGNQFNALFIITRILNPFIFLHTGLLNFWMEMVPGVCCYWYNPPLVGHQMPETDNSQFTKWGQGVGIEAPQSYQLNVCPDKFLTFLLGWVDLLLPSRATESPQMKTQLGVQCIRPCVSVSVWTCLESDTSLHLPRVFSFNFVFWSNRKNITENIIWSSMRWRPCVWTSLQVTLPCIYLGLFHFWRAQHVSPSLLDWPSQG